MLLNDFDFQRKLDTDAEYRRQIEDAKEKYTCKYCGAVSDVPPSEQEPPVDYCQPEDHIEGD